MTCSLPQPRTAVLSLASSAETRAHPRLRFLAAACNDPTKGQAKATAAAAVAATGTAVAGVTFSINPKNSMIGWTGSKVTGKHDGTFQSFTGAITVVDGNIEKSRVAVDI